MSTQQANIHDLRKRVDDVLASNRGTIVPGVIRCVADVLQVDPEQVAMSSTLTNQLAAESLDILDVVFNLERTFHIKIPRGGIRHAAEMGIAGRFDERGVLTAEARDRLRTLMPEVDPALIAPGLTVNGIYDLFTVETLVRLVAWQMVDAAA